MTANRRVPDCHPLLPHCARGLCHPCYSRHDKAGTLGHFPRTTLSGDEFATRYTAMRAAGLSRSAMAAALDMDRHAVAQAYYRAVRRRDITPDEPRVKCGTDGGYHAHRRRGEPSCQPCKDARAAVMRQRYHRAAS